MCTNYSKRDKTLLESEYYMNNDNNNNKGSLMIQIYNAPDQKMLNVRCKSRDWLQAWVIVTLLYPNWSLWK